MRNFFVFRVPVLIAGAARRGGVAIAEHASALRRAERARIAREFAAMAREPDTPYEVLAALLAQHKAVR